MRRKQILKDKQHLMHGVITILCINYILKVVDNILHNVYISINATKLLRESFEMEDASLKKFIVSKFLDFEMVNFKTVMNSGEASTQQKGAAVHIGSQRITIIS